jgi:hypothetical protein
MYDSEGGKLALPEVLQTIIWTVWFLIVLSRVMKAAFISFPQAIRANG